MRLYLAGPMRGYPQFNTQAFDRTAEQLQWLGHRVYNPAHGDRVAGYDWTDAAGTTAELEAVNFDLRGAMRKNMTVICESDGVVVLDHWQNSSGASAEVAAALAIGLPVFYMVDGRPVGFDPELTWVGLGPTRVGRDGDVVPPQLPGQLETAS